MWAYIVYVGLESDSPQIRALWTQQSAAIQTKQEELRQLEESLIKSRKEIEKQAMKLKSSSSTSGANTREAELQSEINKCMVRYIMSSILARYPSDTLRRAY